MVKICYLCNRKQLTGQPISMHRFPKNVKTRKAWISACGLFDEIDDVSRLNICSNHFHPKDYLEPNAKALGVKQLTLKPGAVPSILVPNPLPIYKNRPSSPPEVVILTVPEVKKVEDVEHVSSDRIHLHSSSMTTFPSCDAIMLVSSEVKSAEGVAENSNLNSASDSVICEILKKRKFFEPRFVSEIMIEDVSTPERAQRVLDLVKRTDERRKKKIKYLQNKNKYILKRVSALKDLVVDLHNESLISKQAEDTLLSCIDSLISKQKVKAESQ